MDVQDAKNNGIDAYIDLSQKGNIKSKSTPSNRTKEKVMYSEILAHANTFKETNNRTIDNSAYWGVLSLLVTKLGNEKSATEKDNPLE